MDASLRALPWNHAILPKNKVFRIRKQANSSYHKVIVTDEASLSLVFHLYKSMSLLVLDNLSSTDVKKEIENALPEFSQYYQAKKIIFIYACGYCTWLQRHTYVTKSSGNDCCKKCHSYLMNKDSTDNYKLMLEVREIVLAKLPKCHFLPVALPPYCLHWSFRQNIVEHEKCCAHMQLMPSLFTPSVMKTMQLVLNPIVKNYSSKIEEFCKQEKLPFKDWSKVVGLKKNTLYERQSVIVKELSSLLCEYINDIHEIERKQELLLIQKSLETDEALLIKKEPSSEESEVQDSRDYRNSSTDTVYLSPDTTMMDAAAPKAQCSGRNVVSEAQEEASDDNCSTTTEDYFTPMETDAPNVSSTKSIRHSLELPSDTCATDSLPKHSNATPNKQLASCNAECVLVPEPSDDVLVLDNSENVSRSNSVIEVGNNAPSTSTDDVQVIGSARVSKNKNRTLFLNSSCTAKISCSKKRKQSISDELVILDNSITKDTSNKSFKKRSNSSTSIENIVLDSDNESHCSPISSKVSKRARTSPSNAIKNKTMSAASTEAVPSSSFQARPCGRIYGRRKSKGTPKSNQCSIKTKQSCSEGAKSRTSDVKKDIDEEDNKRNVKKKLSSSLSIVKHIQQKGDILRIFVLDHYLLQIKDLLNESNCTNYMSLIYPKCNIPVAVSEVCDVIDDTANIPMNQNKRVVVNICLGLHDLLVLCQGSISEPPMQIALDIATKIEIFKASILERVPRAKILLWKIPPGNYGETMRGIIDNLNSIILKINLSDASIARTVAESCPYSEFANTPSSSDSIIQDQFLLWFKYCKWYLDQLEAEKNGSPNSSVQNSSCPSDPGTKCLAKRTVPISRLPTNYKKSGPGEHVTNPDQGMTGTRKRQSNIVADGDNHTSVKSVQTVDDISVVHVEIEPVIKRNPSIIEVVKSHYTPASANKSVADNDEPIFVKTSTASSSSAKPSLTKLFTKRPSNHFSSKANFVNNHSNIVYTTRSKTISTDIDADVTVCEDDNGAQSDATDVFSEHESSVLPLSIASTVTSMMNLLKGTNEEENSSLESVSSKLSMNVCTLIAVARVTGCTDEEACLVEVAERLISTESNGVHVPPALTAREKKSIIVATGDALEYKEKATLGQTASDMLHTAVLNLKKVYAG